MASAVQGIDKQIRNAQHTEVGLKRVADNFFSLPKTKSGAKTAADKVTKVRRLLEEAKRLQMQAEQ